MAVCGFGLAACGVIELYNAFKSIRLARKAVNLQLNKL
jgi:hypothetical protein